MLIALIKFIHLLCVLSSVGLVAAEIFPQRARRGISTQCHTMAQSYTSAVKNYRPGVTYIGAFIALAAITGCLLVYPKGYTFHTPWIEAALLLASTVIVGLLVMHGLQGPSQKKTYGLLRSLLSLFLLIILLVIIHDAVQKTTGIPLPWLGPSAEPGG